MGHTLDELLEMYEEDCYLRDLDDETIRRYLSSLRIFAEFLKGKGIYTIEEVNMDVLREFLRYSREVRKVKYKTIENNFSALSSFYDFLTFEGIVPSNIVLTFRKRYLRRYKKSGNGTSEERRLITLEELRKLLSVVDDPRDRAIIVLFAKTGIRREELINIDLDDIDWNTFSITLKPTPKRSNRTVFFDEECAVVLQRWLRVREMLQPRTPALFISYNTLQRLNRNGVWRAVVKYALKVGLHNPESPHLRDHFGPHCFRHFFTTYLIRNGMPREYVKELRGDARRDAVDIYNHIDREELRRAYLTYVPKIGIV